MALLLSAAGDVETVAPSVVVGTESAAPGTELVEQNLEMARLTAEIERRQTLMR